MTSYWSIFLLILIYIGSSSAQDKSISFQTISVNSFFELVENDSVVILDVRTANEFKQGAIPTAINYDFYQTSFSDSLKNLNRTIPIVVYCKVGYRSKKSSEILTKLGFTSIYNLKGGYDAWLKSRNIE